MRQVITDRMPEKLLVVFYLLLNALIALPHSASAELNFSRPAATALEEDRDPEPFPPRLSARRANWDPSFSEAALSAMVGPYSNSDTPPVERFVRLATTDLAIAIYEMEDPGVRAAVRDAISRSVPIRVIMEPNPVGSNCDAFRKKGKRKFSEDCEDLRLLVNQVRRSGGKFVAFRKASLCGQSRRAGRCFQHGKMILINKRLALISTGNFNASSLCNLASRPSTCNRDYTYITRDQRVVGALLEIFERDLAGRRYNPSQIIARHGAQNLLTVSPFSLSPLLSMLDGAEESIQIQNQYLHEDSGLADILREKARAGKRVEIQLADACSFGRISDEKAFELTKFYAALEQDGIKLRMFSRSRQINGKRGYLHAKAIVVDRKLARKRAWIGSVNGSKTSLNQNREFGVFFTHPSRVQALGDFMQEDFEHESSQAWRDSIRCRDIGYRSKEATLSDLSTREAQPTP